MFLADAEPPQGFLRKGPANRSGTLSPKQKYQSLTWYKKVPLHPTIPSLGINPKNSKQDLKEAFVQPCSPPQYSHL